MVEDVLGGKEFVSTVWAFAGSVSEVFVMSEVDFSFCLLNLSLQLAEQNFAVFLWAENGLLH